MTLNISELDVKSTDNTTPKKCVDDSLLNVPEPLFDVKNFLPEGITPSHNGRMPADKLKKIHCGGKLYADAARAWLAMVRAAAQDRVFLNVNQPFKTYRKLESQINVFKKRFVPVEKADDVRENAIRVEFDGKIWQLEPKVAYAAVPGTSSHGFGLAVDIGNSGSKHVKAWLDKNAAQFGFVREWAFENWHFTYIKSREGIPDRVLEIENLPPLPEYTAEQIAEVTGCSWLKLPAEDWNCNGIFYARPVRPGYIAVISQGQDMVGISEQIASKVFRQVAGFICVNPEPLLEFKRPILVTSNFKHTLQKISTFGSF